MRIYLAGPEVFLPEAVALGEAKKASCRRFGFEGLFPFDQQLDGVAPEKLSATIFAANVGMIRAADAVVANLSPFRGVAADAGTVWEIGFAVALDKPVYGYSNDPRNLFDRTAGDLTRAVLKTLDDGRTLHPDGLAIEDFGLADNLMIEESIALSGGAFFVPAGGEALPLDDLSLFETCLQALAERRDAPRACA